MPNRVTKVISAAGGGDYTSLSAWQTAQRKNLVAANEIAEAVIVGSGSAGAVVLGGGWKTDDQHYVVIRAANGHHHNGIYDESKAFIDGGGSICIETQIAHLRVSGLCCKSSATADIKITHGAPSGYILFDQCIVKDATHGFWLDSGLGTNLVENCVSYNHTETGSICVPTNNAVLRVFNSTMVGAQYGLRAHDAGAGSRIFSENNYLHGGISAYGETGGGVIKEGTRDATSDNSAAFAPLRNIPHSAATFVNVVAATADYHLVDIEALADQGVSLASSGLTKDYENQTRGALYDVGADEFAPFNVPIAHLGICVSGAPRQANIAKLGCLVFGKPLAHANLGGFLGAYLLGLGSTLSPKSLGIFIDALETKTTPLAKLGIFLYSSRYTHLASLGVFTRGYPQSTRFAETHARTLVKANSNDVVDQDLFIDAQLILKGLSQKDFNAKFIGYRTTHSEFDAKLKIERYTIPPTVFITKLERILGSGEAPTNPMPNFYQGARKVRITASGYLGSCPEWTHASIAFGEYARNGVDVINHAESGFTSGPPWVSEHDYSISGIYMVTARGVDNCGQVGMDVRRLNLASGLTSGTDFTAISISGIPRMGEVPDPLPVDFTVAKSGVGNINSPTDSNLIWYFGNRESSHKKAPRTRYVSPGLYIVTCSYLYMKQVGNKKVPIYSQDSLLLGFNQ